MNKKLVGEDKFNIRRTQLIVPFGVGSILNMLPNESLMLCGLDEWNESAGEKVYDERLQKYLKVKYFKIPASEENCPKGLPFVRFPKWYYCPNCGSLKPLSEWKKNWFEYHHQDFDHPRCYKSGCREKLLNPSRFIIACKKGHIDDFPWIEWVHGNNLCSKPDLEYKIVGGTSGLSSIKINCRNCPERKTMAGSFNKDIFKKMGFRCTGRKPWQGKDNREKCEEYPITLQRGASNVYFPKVVSSICIPPYSDDICTKIQSTDEWKVLSSQTGGISDDKKNWLIEIIAENVNESKDSINKVIDRMLKSSSGDVERQSDTEYRYDEYRALTGDVKTGQIDSKNFDIEIINGKEYKIKGIKNVTLVHRLREIRSLVAFNRIQPIETDYFSDMEEEEGKEEFSSMRIAEKADKIWLPAVEANGEGIFLDFNGYIINKWKNNEEIQKRVSVLQERSDKMSKTYNRPSKNITASFLLLHTFAHILIRQLSFECGYSVSSLRERIYCGEINESSDMTGFLIYTAGGDSDGSMGGLARQGRPDKLSDIIEKAIKKSSWCSSDPVCIESRGQGLGSLNLAACFACVLLPETSCETGNKFLDRAMLVGLPDKPEIGFYREVF
ncbi:MAG: DUF1998 domain-containing protein [Candidatus Atribacteria bacterium]